MKAFLKKVFLAGLVVFAGGTAALAAGPGAVGASSGLCVLIGKMYGVFNILRTLAFVGAAFIIANWAWGFITAGDVKMDDLKKKGMGLLVGFVLLFGIGVVLSFLLSSSGASMLGCPEILSW